MQNKKHFTNDFYISISINALLALYLLFNLLQLPVKTFFSYFNPPAHF